MADLSVSSLCEKGICNNTHTIEDGFRIEDKVYTKDDAELIERAGFARTQIFDSSALDGSRDLGDDNLGPIVTIIPGMKAGFQQEIYAEHYEADWLGELDGRLANKCAYHPRTVRRVVEVERTMCAKKVFVESDLCYAELIETYKQNLLLAGALNEANTNIMNELVLDAFIEANHINIDRHAWRGDYGSPDARVKHVDGFFKIAVNAMETSQGQKLSFTFVGDLTDLSIIGLAGGHDFAIDFDTDSDATVAKFAAYLRTLMEPMTGRKLYKSVVVTGTRQVDVEAHDGEVIALNVVVGVGADGFEQCPADGTIKPCTPADPTVASVTCEETQAAVSCYARLALI